MLKKSYALAIAATTVGLMGFAVPMASAATLDGPVLNVSNNQVPIQACGNDVAGNGLGGQVPAEGAALAGALFSRGSVNASSSTNNRGCEMWNTQVNSGHQGTHAFVNVSGNQVPVQACGNELNGNVAGGQVPLTGLAGAFAFLSPLSSNMATSVNNNGCALANGQVNGTQGW